MPEGDTIHGLADRLEDALGGATVTAATGTHRAVIEHGRRIVGATITAVTAHGKHLLLYFSNGWALRTHLRMTGTWHVYRHGEPWRKTAGKARVVLETPSLTAVCFAAPTVQLAPSELVARRIAELGPDLMQPVDAAAVAARIRRMATRTAINEALVDQKIVAGLGNVYKSELLFLEGIHPDCRVADLSPRQIIRLVARANDLLTANRGRRRTTTGRRAPAREMWVYARTGRPCRRCGSPIAMARRGPLQRTTYWCTICQPHPHDGDD